MVADYRLHPLSNLLMSAICCFLSFITLDMYYLTNPKLLTTNVSIDSVGNLVRLLVALFYLQQGQTVVVLILRFLLEPFDKAHRWFVRSIAVCSIIAILCSSMVRYKISVTRWFSHDNALTQLGILLPSFIMCYISWAWLLLNARIHAIDTASKHEQVGSAKHDTCHLDKLQLTPFGHIASLSQPAIFMPRWTTSTSMVNTILTSILVLFVKSIYRMTEDYTKYRWESTYSDMFRLSNTLFTAGSAIIGGVLVGIYQFRFVRSYGWV